MICKKHGVAGGGIREGSLEEVTPKPECRVGSRGGGGAGVCGGGAEPGEQYPSTRRTTALPSAGPTSLESNAEQIRWDCLKESQITRCPGKPTTSPGRPRVSVSVEPKQSSGWGGERARLPMAGTFRAGQEVVGEDTGTAARVRSRTSEGHHPLGQPSWHQGLVSRKTIFPRMGVGMVRAEMQAMGSSKASLAHLLCSPVLISRYCGLGILLKGIGTTNGSGSLGGVLAVEL